MPPDPTTPTAATADPIERLGDLVGQLVDELRTQNDKLDGATAAMDRQRRKDRLSIAAVLVLVLSLAWAGYRDQLGTCQRGNAIRSSMVATAELILDGAAEGLAGDDPAARAEALAIAGEILADVAADPRLAQRECGLLG